MSRLYIKDAQSERSLPLTKKLTSVGNGVEFDLSVGASERGALFSLLQLGAGEYQLLPSATRLLLNGKPVSAVVTLQSCDRLDWPGGTALWLNTSDELTGAEVRGSTLDSLKVLSRFAARLDRKGALIESMHELLDYVVSHSGAETAYLLSEEGDERGWKLVASRSLDGRAPAPSSRDLFSGTVLGEAIRRREAVCLESLIGHPWAKAESVVAARIFSVACLPLLADDRIFGALYLFTRSPGRSVRKEFLDELTLLASQAALMLAAQFRLSSVRSENASLRKLVPFRGPRLVPGTSREMAELLSRLDKFAASTLNLLVLGETGTGKELVAREIHDRSARRERPFIAVNCAAIPESLLESTLFGHERGAFTGAVKSQEGRFKTAHGGTLFLDEIGDLPLEMQAKLLRVLQEKQIEPVGSARPVTVDVRIVAATHRDLEKCVREGRFREDLYYRLNGATLRLPALRHRRDDVLPLARHFLAIAGSNVEVSPEAASLLREHAWPGNVRELEQVLNRASLLCEAGVIRPDDLELSRGLVDSSLENEAFWSSLREAQAEFTRGYVNRALARNQGNRAQTAAQLGLSERSLYRILAQTGPTDEAGSEA